MARYLVAATLLIVLAEGFALPGAAAADDTKGKTCRMEQQCHWVNFKKICTYVKVCR